VVVLLYGLLIVYATVTERPSAPTWAVPDALQAKTGEARGMPSPREILVKYAQALERNDGRLAASESDLPYSRELIRGSVLNTEWIEYSRDVREFLKTAVLELEGFVPDDDAILVLAYQRKKPLADSDKKRAEEVLNDIRRKHAKIIAQMRNETWYGSADRFERVLASVPVTIGLSRRSLNAADANRTAQQLGFVAIFVWLAFIAFRLVGIIASRRFLALLRNWWRFLIFSVVTWFIGAAGEVAGFFYFQLSKTNALNSTQVSEYDTILDYLTGGLTLALDISLAIFIVGLFFDLLVGPAIRRNEIAVVG
jgi:hypothetical protein